MFTRPIGENFTYQHEKYVVIESKGEETCNICAFDRLCSNSISIDDVAGNCFPSSRKDGKRVRFEKALTK